ncbi:MAG: VWA domain-containing protein [Deltaproteobacteria bacterium]|nr:VWA domain-containing protein [Deltaproteobacteria bacterium]
MKLALCFTTFFILSLPAIGSHATTRDMDDISPGLHIDAGDRTIALPLLKTKVTGDIKGFVANVDVVQQFVNPYDSHIEATYVFPLPENGAVYRMEMWFRKKKVVAIIKKREEAIQQYEEAVRAGKTAALLNQERPNIFTQKVGNIPPGEKVDVKISYVEALPYEKGVSSFVFPTVVGPRFIPAGEPTGQPDKNPQGRVSDNTRVLDASAITPPSFDEGETGAHRIDLQLTVRPGTEIRKIESPSHNLHVNFSGKKKATVSIVHGDRIPNKDFVLKIDLRSKSPNATVLTHKDTDDSGYMTLSIQPPLAVGAKDATPKDLFFVVDNSGSMSGAPLNASKALIKQALSHMNPKDRFTVMRFSDDVSSLSQTPLANTTENVAAAMQYVDEMHGMGGTQMLSGIRRALEGTTPEERVRIVFFLTDGYIGNDAEILNAVREENTAKARLFSLGVGSSVNRYLLSGMARLGRGKMMVMRHDEDPAPFVKTFYDRVRNPVLTDVRLQWDIDGATVDKPAIDAIPDLFDGEPLLVHSRYRGDGRGTLKITGRLGGQSYSHEMTVTLPKKQHNPDVARLWARAMIEKWSDEETARPGSHQADIEEVALNHSLMSKYTSFVAVASEVTRDAGDPLIPVTQRLPLPEGVSRNALGSLSRTEIPPGDPFIAVNAPADAAKVTAVFPFGLTKDLAWDATRERWRGRFLVPVGIPDGYYETAIVITAHNGTVTLLKQMFHLDSEGAEFEINFDHIRVKKGRGLLMKVDTIEPASEVYVHCKGLNWRREVFELSSEDDVLWQRWMRIPTDAAPGQYKVLVVARDKAGNRIEQTVTITVYGGDQ